MSWLFDSAGRVRVLILLLSGLFFYLNFAAVRSAPFDDTYITFHYAKHLGEGAGLTWNYNEAPTEGYTNFLYIVLLAPFSTLSIDLLTTSQILNCLLVIATCFLLCDFTTLLLAKSLTPRQTRVAGVGTAFLYLADPFTWLNAMSGMETILFCFLVTLTLFLASHIAHGRDVLKWSYIAACLAGLARPEGFLLGGILTGYYLLLARKRADLPLRLLIQRFLICFITPLACYLLWKQLYFGDILPNSFYVKVLQAKLGFVETFRIYDIYWYLRGVCYLCLPAGILLFWKAQRPYVLLMFLWSALLTGFYLNAALLQPNYSRFLFSIETLLTVCASTGIAMMLKRYSSIVLGFGLWSFGLFHYYRSESYRNASSMEHRDLQFDSRYKSMASFLHQLPHERDIVIALGDAGVVPYYSNVRSLDLVGLNDNTIARSSTVEQALSYVAYRMPDIILLPIDHDGVRPDGCRQVVRWAHGIAGPMTPKLPFDPRFKSYTGLAALTQQAYDLLLWVNTESKYYPEIRDNLQIFRTRQTVFADRPTCIY